MLIGSEAAVYWRQSSATNLPGERMAPNDSVAAPQSSLTTDYIVAEDRMRLTASAEGQAPLIVWLTHRLTRGLVSSLVRWLDHRAGPASTREVVHMFEQEAARNALTPVSPVRITGTGNAARASITSEFEEDVAALLPERQALTKQPFAGLQWTAVAIDLAPDGDQLALTFRAADGSILNMALGHNEVRRWLLILHALWQHAGWPGDVWPEWARMRPAAEVKTFALN
jgi:hypothetical protein